MARVPGRSLQRRVICMCCTAYLRWMLAAHAALCVIAFLDRRPLFFAFSAIMSKKTATTADRQAISDQMLSILRVSMAKAKHDVQNTSGLLGKSNSITGDPKTASASSSLDTTGMGVLKDMAPTRLYPAVTPVHAPSVLLGAGAGGVLTREEVAEMIQEAVDNFGLANARRIELVMNRRTDNVVFERVCNETQVKISSLQDELRKLNDKVDNFRMYVDQRFDTGKAELGRVESVLMAHTTTSSSQIQTMMKTHRDVIETEMKSLVTRIATAETVCQNVKMEIANVRTLIPTTATSPGSAPPPTGGGTVSVTPAPASGASTSSATASAGGGTVASTSSATASAGSGTASVTSASALATGPGSAPVSAGGGTVSVTPAAAPATGSGSAPLPPGSGTASAGPAAALATGPGSAPASHGGSVPVTISTNTVAVLGVPGSETVTDADMAELRGVSRAVVDTLELFVTEMYQSLTNEVLPIGDGGNLLQLIEIKPSVSSRIGPPTLIKNDECIHVEWLYPKSGKLMRETLELIDSKLEDRTGSEKAKFWHLNMSAVIKHLFLFTNDTEVQVFRDELLKMRGMAAGSAGPVAALVAP